MTDKELKQKFVEHTAKLISSAEKTSPEPALEEQIRENMKVILSCVTFG